MNERILMKFKLQIAAAMAIFGTIPVFVRNIPVSSATLALLRAAVAAIFLLTVRAAAGKPIRFNKMGKDAIPLFFSGAAMGFNWILLFEAFNHTTVAVATLCYYMQPTIVVIASTFLFKEKMTGKKIFALLLAFTGCVLVSGVGGDTAFSWKGILLGLGSGFFYALYSIFGRYAINRGYGAWTMTFYTFLFCSIGCAFLSDWQVIGSVMSASGSNILWVLGLGFVTAFLPYVLYSLGLEHMESSKASILASVEPVVSTLFGVFVFHERLSLWGVLGIAMVLGAIIVLNAKRKNV